ncbi:HEPN domain-containing protein [Candidatus Parcubacteria bacterium]|nr:HEPN domain-containing protein [Candidatus Parcubacteria bacterium]
MNIHLEKNIEHWLKGSKNDFKVAQDLFNLKHYSHCLFFCHLSVEKLLKGIVVKETNDFAPYIHDLRELAERANVELNSEQEKILDEIFSFNIAGRYAEAKLEFYKSNNDIEYAQEYLEITNNVLKWLKKEFQQKLKK